jgi:DNA-directed RNA polymerase subunit RPC12/RpoP
MPQEQTTVFCPSCGSRMSVRHHAIGDTDEVVYHCAMCDLELNSLTKGDAVRTLLSSDESGDLNWSVQGLGAFPVAAIPGPVGSLS